MDQLLHALKRLLPAILLLSLATGAAKKDSTPVQRLVRAYPEFLKSIDGDTIVWQDGAHTLLDDGREPASYVERLDHADLRDQLSQPYPACQPITTPEVNVDPGRLRDEAFFGKMYGDSAVRVRAHLVPVDWFGQKVLFTQVNGADRALAAVTADLARHPELLRFARPSAGTFVWRDVEGTARRSMHAYGAAIDLNVKLSDYWRWTGAREGQPGLKYRNRFPLALARIFERHGFVWGGRWYHFDTMHFEYRSELTGPWACPKLAPK